MELINNYPNINKKINKFLLVRRILLITFLVSLIVCFIVNICVGGKPWTIYVFCSEAIFYLIFLNKPLIENTFIKRFSIIILSICILLYVIDRIEKIDFSYFVITIICFSLLIVQIITLFSSYKNQKRNIMPIFYTSIGSIVIIILALIGVIKLNWPIIVLGSIGLCILLLFFTLFRNVIIYELKKQFSTK